MTHIERAIIPVAGLGTRRFPITTVIEKCMLPIGNRPVIDYVVSDCLAAGVEHITFVVNPKARQLREYYGSKTSLEKYLASRGKHEALEQVKSIGGKATFDYIVQTQGEDSPYGTAIPLSLVSGDIGAHEQTLVAMGDDLLYNTDNTSELGRLVHETTHSHAHAGMLAVHMGAKAAAAYGVILTSAQDDRQFFRQVIEKPDLIDSGSVLVNPGKYLFDRAMFDCIEEVVAGPAAPNGEHMLTDALNLYVSQHRLLVVSASGEYLDTGSESGWLYANNRILGTRTSIA